MLFTSHYYNNKLPVGANIVSISYSVTEGAKSAISRFDWKQYTPLAPPWWLVDQYKKGNVSVDEYTSTFNHQLNQLSINKVIADIGKDAILVCYELPNQFCHRHLVAEWIKSYGHDIEEFDIKHQHNSIMANAFDF